MAHPLLTGIGLATLLAASASAGASGTGVASRAGDTAANPLLAPWGGPYGGVPPFDRRQGRALPAGARSGDGRAARRGRSDRGESRAGDLRQHDRRPRGRRPHTRPGRHGLSSLRRHDEHPRGAGGRARDGAEARGLRRPDHPEREALRAHRGGLRSRARAPASPPSSSASSGSATPTSCAPERGSTRPPRSACRRSTSASRPCSPSSARTSSPTRPTTSSSSRPRPTSSGLPPSLRAAASAAAESRGHQGKWAILNTRSSMEPFLTYSDRRDLREKVWRTYFSRGDNGDAHDNNAGITEILMLRGERAKLIGYADPRPPPTGELDGEDPGAHARAHGGGLEAGGGARPRRGRRHAEDRRSSAIWRPDDDPSSPGTTATTPRRCARRATTSTRTR